MNLHKGAAQHLSPLLKIWERNRARGVAPRRAGKLDDTPELRGEFLLGASLMGYELVDLADPEAVSSLVDPPRLPLQPQQLLVTDSINAGLKRNAVEMPRRSSKSTALFMLLLGRCASRPGYRVTFSAQTGTAGTEMFEVGQGRPGLRAAARGRRPRTLDARHQGPLLQGRDSADSALW